MALPLLGKKIVKKNGQEIQENPERPLCFSQAKIAIGQRVKIFGLATIFPMVSKVSCPQRHKTRATDDAQQRKEIVERATQLDVVVISLNKK
ncbi:Hypothetical predicted protein [Olea europaea subsp. europaea]|uniref:Uncharacterized protein n=1 Tax=Olea europaea subsp. europaea TaxID=158383 RepID=A0A8S0TZJ2_OLEEU|nr:Hypothetical predicted protein [Olea europaea subsp. europaea]